MLCVQCPSFCRHHYGGNYTSPADNMVFPRIQVNTISELLRGVRPKTPPLLLPYIQAPRAVSQHHIQDMLTDDAG